MLRHLDGGDQETPKAGRIIWIGILGTNVGTAGGAMRMMGCWGAALSPGSPPMLGLWHLTVREVDITGGYQPTRQYKTPPVSHQNVDSINTLTFGSFENWNKDRVEEEKRRRASFEMIRKEQHQDLQENKKAPDRDKENLGDGIMTLLEDSGGKRDAPTKSDKQSGLKVSSLSKEDAIKAAPLLPTPTTDALKPLNFTNGLPEKSLQIQQLNTEDILESSICSQRLSGGGILGSGHEETLSPKLMVPFSHSKCGSFHMRSVTVAECHKPAFSGSSQEGAGFDKEGLEIHLPEEDTLFSVNDFLYTQNTDQWSAAEGANFDKEGIEIHLPEEDTLFSVNDFSYTQNTGQWSAAEWDRSEGLLPKDNIADMNYRFQSLDVLASQSHGQIDPNNLYHLFENRPSPEFLPSRLSDGNRQAPFHMPKAIHHGAYGPFPQDMKSMEHVLRAPVGPCAGPAAPHHTLPHMMTMPGSFLPLQGFPRCAPLPQPVHCTPDYRTEMTDANSFQMHHRLPGYGETGMMMAGQARSSIRQGYLAGQSKWS